MTSHGRPDGMSALEWLVALEEIKQLKARRDRFVDAHDYEAYESLHAPDHVSHNKGYPPWTSSAEMITNVRRAMAGLTTAHHSHTPEITFESPTKATGIWAMSGASLWQDEGVDRWRINFGYYFESYERRDGQWLFTSRRWDNTFAISSDGVMIPADEAPPAAER
jgi:SnoaL-like domain